MQDTFTSMFDKIQRAQSSFHQAVTAWNKFNASADLDDVLIADAVFRYSIWSGYTLMTDGIDELNDIFREECERGPTYKDLNFSDEEKMLARFYDHITKIPHRFHLGLANDAAQAANKVQAKLLIEITQFIQDQKKYPGSFLNQRQSPKI